MIDNPNVRALLVFLAAAVAATAAAPPVDLPGWAAALLAASAAGFAGLGLLPPTWVKSSGHTAVKRAAAATQRRRATDHRVAVKPSRRSR